MHEVDRQPPRYKIMHSVSGTPLSRLLTFTLITLIAKLIVALPFCLLLYFCSGLFLTNALTFHEVLQLGNLFVVLLFVYEVVFIGLNLKLKDLIGQDNIKDAKQVINTFGYQLAYIQDTPAQVENLDDPGLKPALQVAYQTLLHNNHRTLLIDPDEKIVGGVRIMNADGQLGEMQTLTLTDSMTTELMNQIRSALDQGIIAPLEVEPEPAQNSQA